MSESISNNEHIQKEYNNLETQLKNAMLKRLDRTLSFMPLKRSESRSIKITAIKQTLCSLKK